MHGLSRNMHHGIVQPSVTESHSTWPIQQMYCLGTSSSVLPEVGLLTVVVMISDFCNSRENMSVMSLKTRCCMTDELTTYKLHALLVAACSDMPCATGQCSLLDCQVGVASI